jgi:Flp pilus assembly secretin CpaC
MRFLKTLFSKIFIVTALSLVFSAYSYAEEVINLDLSVGQTEEVHLVGKMTNVVVSKQGVAKVTKHGARSATILASKAGKTDITFLNKKKVVRKIHLTVTKDASFSGNNPDPVVFEDEGSSYSAGESSGLKGTLRSLFPAERVGMQTVNGATVLTGNVSDAETAAQIIKIAQEYQGKKGKIINLMRMKTGQQVMLRVRVGEIRRDSVDKLGLGLHGIISSGSAVFGALERDGLFKVLAEPTLTAISGETANFFAGSEFPIQVSQPGNTMSVEYKPFGVSVDFTPLVLSGNRIRLDVASEVSEINDKMRVGSSSAPAISTRKANTTIELAPGESYMIAGLIKDHSGANIYKVPGLGDIPILSPLFRSAEFQRDETELVIAVTPYLADPVASDDIRMPTEDVQNTSTLEMLFLGNIEAHKKAGAVSGAPTSGATTTAAPNAAQDNKKPIEGSVGYLTD